MTALRLLLSFAGAGVCAACATQAPRTATPVADATIITFETETSAAAGAKLPFVPTRLSATDYSWRRSPKTACAQPTHLRFDGPHGEFPLLPDAPEPDAEALDTWGTGPLEATTEPSAPRSADRVIAALRPRFRSCFGSWLERGSTAEGSVRFALQLACTGEVDAVTAKSSGVDEPTIACLFGVIAQAEFEPPGAGQTMLQVPVVFKNTER